MSEWSDIMPKTVGCYEITAMETDYEVEQVEIFRRSPKSQLMVRDDKIGECNLTAYHWNLTELKWRKIDENIHGKNQRNIDRSR